MSPFQPKAFDLPVEVIDMIVDWLHRRSDILSLALSHSRFYQVVVPYHLHYRQVEFCIFDYAMWSYLLEDPRRLGKIEVLNLSTQHRPRVPPIEPLSNEPEVLDNAAKVDSDLIHNAFKGMRMLHTVIWDSTGSNSGATGIECLRRAMGLQIPIWEAINSYCPSVQRVDILGLLNCWRCYTEIAQEAPSPLQNLSGITTFTFRVDCYRHMWPVNTYFSFLSSFQRLQHLTLLESNSIGLNIPQILSIKFPILESFTARDFTRAVSTTTMLAFLAAHPLLHTFIWTTLTNVLTTDPLNTSAINSLDVAPRLERLVSPRSLVQVLFQPSRHESGVRRPLRSLCTRLPLDTQAPPADLLSGIGPGLEELIVCDEPGSVEWKCRDLGAALRVISSSFPNLRLLDLGSVYINDWPASVKGPRPKVHDWMSALSDLKHLVVLIIPWSQAEKHGFMVRSSPSKRRHQMMEHFLAQCPRLRFLFCRHWQVTVPRKEAAIVIGHSDADVRFRKACLIDEGSNGDRRWAAYEGKQSDLAEEIRTAVKARR